MLYVFVSTTNLVLPHCSRYVCSWVGIVTTGGLYAQWSLWPAGFSGVNLSSLAKMAKDRAESSSFGAVISIFTILTIPGNLVPIAYAGSVRISQDDTPLACTGSTCMIPGCNLAANRVHGCTGDQTKVGRCPGTKGFDQFKDVCKGGQFSIDWRIKPLRLQFRNTANDFEECLLKEAYEGQGFPPTPPSARRYYTCNMGRWLQQIVRLILEEMGSGLPCVSRTRRVLSLASQGST